MNETLQKLGRYLILGEIAQGGMAVIYRGKLLGVEGFEKNVAIKKILPFWSQNAEFISMLIDEAKILVELHHPNIVQIFELGKEQDSYFIAMEYVNGFDLRTLGKALKNLNQRLPDELVAFILKQICLGLDFAHNKTDAQNRNLNLVHRDISPQNILIGSHGEVKITDFGIAKTTQKSTQTQTGVVKGKFSYMSPEQVLGEEIDQQSDLFALGVLLYEMVAGQKCFDGKNDFEIIEKVKRAEIVWPETLVEPLQTLLRRALAVKKSERYVDALSFYNDLELWETTFAKKAQARDLKNFLHTHFPDQFQKNAEISFSPSFNAKTVIAEPSNNYTILTEATQIAAQTRLHAAPEATSSPHSQKTRILPSENADFGKTKILPVQATATRSNNKMIVAALLLSCVLVAFWLIAKRQPPTPSPELETPTNTARDDEPAAAQPVLAATTPNPDTNSTSAADTTVPAVLTTPHGSVTIATEPPEAHIKLTAGEQTYTGQGRLTQTFDFAGSETLPITVTAELGNYKPQTLALTLSAQNPELQKTITLQPIEFGKISVSSRPWASFKIDGFSSKTFTTPGSVKLPVGQYTLRVTAPSQGKSVSKTVTIKANQTASCRAAFAETASLSCGY